MFAGDYSGKILLFFNCRLYKDEQIIRGELWVKDGKIIAPRTSAEAAFKFDCLNNIISPGYLDLQINGAFDMDFLLDDDKETSLKRVKHELLATGCTGFCPTLITAPPKLYHEAFPYYKKTSGSKHEGAACLGIHCEGPFLNPKKKGAHPEECILNFDNGWQTVEEVYGTNLEDLSIVTMAVEKEHSEEVIRELRKRDVKVSIGHTMATLDDCNKAVAAGANKITHLFNAMPAFHHRDPSVPGLLPRAEALDQEVFYGIIADGIHTHTTAVRLAHKMHPNGMCLVTDAIGPMGQGAGDDFLLGTVPCQVLSPDGIAPLRAYVKGTTTLCGAICPLDQCVRYAKEFLECDNATVLKCVTTNPAKCLGIENTKGTLAPGADADFLVLDEDLNVLRTWMAGEEAFVAEGFEHCIRQSCISSN